MPSFMTRIWSIIRLIVILLVPGIGILIMSTLHSPSSQQSVIATKYLTGQVQIQMVFSPVLSAIPYFGYDNQPINASVAAEYTSFTDLLLS